MKAYDVYDACHDFFGGPLKTQQRFSMCDAMTTAVGPDFGREAQNLAAVSLKLEKYKEAWKSTVWGNMICSDM